MGHIDFSLQPVRHLLARSDGLLAIAAIQQTRPGTTEPGAGPDMGDMARLRHRVALLSAALDRFATGARAQQPATAQPHTPPAALPQTTQAVQPQNSPAAKPHNNPAAQPQDTPTPQAQPSTTAQAEHPPATQPSTAAQPQDTATAWAILAIDATPAPTDGSILNRTA